MAPSPLPQASAEQLLVHAFAHAARCARCGLPPADGEQLELVPGRVDRWRHCSCAPEDGACERSSSLRHLYVLTVRDCRVLELCAWCGTPRRLVRGSER